MNIAFWCILITAYMPIFWTALAKFTGAGFSQENNRNPREFMENLSGYRKRAHWAQLNSFEAFPPFAVAVIIANLAHAPQATVDALAVLFVLLRFVYGALYLADNAGARSVVWFSSVGCVIAIFIVAS